VNFWKKPSKPKLTFLNGEISGRTLGHFNADVKGQFAPDQRAQENKINWEFLEAINLVLKLEAIHHNPKTNVNK